MRHLSRAFTFLLPVVLLSCTEVTPTSVNTEQSPAAEDLRAMLSGENGRGIAVALSNHFGAQDGYSKGAKFIVPFETASSFGIGIFTPGSPPSLKSIGFTAALTDEDFYRENNDGTVSVHVSSNDALAEYSEDLFDPEAFTASGSNARYTANYSGPVIEFETPFGIIRFIDLNSGLNRALSVHGNGKVQDGDGNSYKLSLAITQTPSGNRRSEFTLK